MCYVIVTPGSGASSYVFGVRVPPDLLVYFNVEFFYCVVVMSGDSGGSNYVLWVYWYALHSGILYWSCGSVPFQNWGV